MDSNMDQGGVNPTNQQPPLPAPPQNKKGKTSLIIGIVAGAVALAAIIVVLVLFVFTPNAGSGSVAEVRDPMPMFYMEDDDVYLASGMDTVELEGAAITEGDYVSYINGMASFDRRYVYYLAEVDEETGAGKLMAVDLKGDLKPQEVADDVCAAKIAPYGKYYLYLTDIEDGVGSLYYGELGKEADKVSNDVPEGEYELSPDGKSYYYIKQMSDDEDLSFAIYAALNGEEPAKVDEGEAGKGDFISSVFVLDSGEVVYEFETMDEDTYEYSSTLYVFKDGDRDKIATDSSIREMFGDSDDMLYSEDRTLYYKAPGEDKERISQDYNWVMFPPYFGADINYVNDKHFLLIEDDATEDDPYPDQVTLYEVQVGEDPIKITKADSWGYQLNSDFKWVSFQRDGETYLCYKDKDGWSDRIHVCDSAIKVAFDMSGKYLYYLESYDEDDDYGDLYRYALSDKTEEGELMQYDVNFFDLMDDVVYTRNTDDEIYRVESKEEKTLLFDEETVGADMAPDGIYVYVEAKEYDIYFVPVNGEDSETICLDAQEVLFLDGEITHNFTPPMPEDVVEMMREIYADTIYFQDIINKTGQFVDFVSVPRV